MPRRRTVAELLLDMEQLKLTQTNDMQQMLRNHREQWIRQRDALIEQLKEECNWQPGMVFHTPPDKNVWRVHHLEVRLMTNGYTVKVLCADAKWPVEKGMGGLVGEFAVEALNQKAVVHEVEKEGDNVEV